MDNFHLLRASGFVRRFHAIPFAPSNLIGEHCYQMLVILLMTHPNPSLDLIKAIVFHDAHEIELGDMPGNIKRSAGFADVFREIELAWNESHGIVDESHLSENDQKWLKALDAIESMFWCADQEAVMTHRYLLAVKERYADYIDQMDLPEELIDFLNNLGTQETKDEGVDDGE